MIFELNTSILICFFIGFFLGQFLASRIIGSCVTNIVGLFFFIIILLALIGKINVESFPFGSIPFVRLLGRNELLFLLFGFMLAYLMKKKRPRLFSR